MACHAHAQHRREKTSLVFRQPRKVDTNCQSRVARSSTAKLQHPVSKQSRNFSMIANGREDQCLPALIPRFQVCSLREKQLDQADVSLSGSQDQRPVVKTIARFDRRAALDQKLRSIAMPQFASMMERSSTIFVRFVQGLAPVFKDFCDPPSFTSYAGRAQQFVR